MKTKKLALGCPLLVKELTELAARKRTYQLRVLYAVILFATALTLFWAQLFDGFDSSGSPLSVLGRGDDMFQMLVALQFVGIYLFLPAMTCPAITSEKERDALPLLLLTRLGPWTIILEKLASRLIPMFTFLLLALPLMAFAYTFGGIQQQQIWGAILMLAVASIQVAALCMMCSAYFRTTVGAFIAVYFIGAALFPGLPILVDQFIVHLNADIALMLVAPYVYDVIFQSGAGGNLWGELSLRLIPFVASTAVFLGLARFFLIRRAFAQPRHLLRNFFKWLDRVFVAANENRITKGIVVVREVSSLPLFNPVAWREAEKKNLGQFRYLLRVFLGLEIPVLVVGATTIIVQGSNARMDNLSMLLFVMWIFVTMILSVQSSSLISGERSRQTLDVLLVTPLSGREIILEKVQGLRRLIWVISACFVTAFLFEVWWNGSVGHRSWFGYSWSRYLVGSMLSLLVYLPLVIWLSMWIGLKTKSQTRAILLSLATITAWCLIPFGVFILFAELTGTEYTSILFLAPCAMIVVNELNEFPKYSNAMDTQAMLAWVVILVNYAWYGGWVLVFRGLSLRHADRYLGRRDELWDTRFPPQSITAPNSENILAASSSQ